MSTIIDWPLLPFTWAQARDHGISREQVRGAIRAGTLRRVLKGVYVSSALVDSIETRCAAISLVMRPYDVVCDRTAAWLHGIDALAEWELDSVPPLECVVLPELPRSRHQVCAGGERDLAPRDIETIANVRVTTPLRTALDLGCRPGAGRALGVLDQFMRVCGVTRAEMLAAHPRYRGRRGVIQLRKVVPLADPTSESTGESWMRMCIADYGLPAPVIQYWILIDGQPTYRLDLAYPRCKVAVEYDGREFHDSAEGRRRDELRRGWLRENGWTVLVIRAEDLTGLAAMIWLGRLKDALAGTPLL